jgi:hypothetical protein
MMAGCAIVIQQHNRRSKALGLTVPPTLITFADEVFE